MPDIFNFFSEFQWLRERLYMFLRLILKVSRILQNIFVLLFSAEPQPPPPSTSKNEDPTKIQIRNESKLITESDDNSYSVPMDVLHSISKNFEKLQADFEKSTTPDENRKIRIKSIRTVPPGMYFICLSKNLNATVSIQERVMMARVRYIFYIFLTHRF